MLTTLSSCDLVQQLNVDDMTGAHIQNVWFSTDCSHSFARFLLPNGKHYIRMWRIKDGDLVDQIHYKIVGNCYVIALY